MQYEYGECLIQESDVYVTQTLQYSHSIFTTRFHFTNYDNRIFLTGSDWVPFYHMVLCVAQRDCIRKHPHELW